MVMDWGTREPPAAMGLLKSGDPGEFLLGESELVDLSYEGRDSEIFSDIALSYINEMLMEEEMDDKLSVGEPPLALDPLVDVQADGSAHGGDLAIPFCAQPPAFSFELADEVKLVQEYLRGVEEASKFLPPPKLLELDDGKKSSRARDMDEEEESRSRRSRRAAAAPPPAEEVFDKILLCPEGCPNDSAAALRRALRGARTKAGGGRRRGNGEVVDLRTILVQCAQAVAADDRRAARELLARVRAHGSATGDATQRLAVILADGLEARLAGTGTRIYQTLLARTQSAAALLKAYHLYLAACPFKKISHFFANQTILGAAAGRRRLHIVDFGVYLGFQWPCLIQRLAARPGGPPAVRITGVELPQPGFCPADRVADTGQRLQRYADMFGVPFDYRALVAARWEDITAADLAIEEDEVLVVNCLYRLRNVPEDTREKVLQRIVELRPEVFVHGVVNGAYGAPFFATRFREALFHFSALFDMLDATVPREEPERLLIEREIFGKEVINVVACEGAERVERPETYRQWQARNTRAGLVQRALDKGILSKAREKVGACYDKDFLIGEDGGWLLQGWKGRIIYAISTWRPSSSPPTSRS
ncbi:scarecrow-like protein 9 [Wolffia australiana]